MGNPWINETKNLLTAQIWRKTADFGFFEVSKPLKNKQLSPKQMKFEQKTWKCVFLTVFQFSKIIFSF